MSTQTLTPAQTKWLAANKLEVRFDERGDIYQVQPVGANVWVAPFVRVQCWGPQYAGGPKSFDVISVYVCGAFNMPSPAGRTISKHTTLKAALAALVKL